MNGVDFVDFEAFKKISENPERTDQFFQIQQTLLKNPKRGDTTQWSRKACLESSEFMALYERKYIPEFPTLEELESCPTGSLGRVLGKHLRDNGIAIDFKGLDTSTFYKQDVDHLGYLAIRTIRMHDVFHVVMGLGTAPIDEYALFNVQMAQFASPYHMILFSSGYFYTAMNTPEQIPQFLETVHRYFVLGKKAKFLAGFPYEDNWRTDLQQVRTMLNIELPS